jgi:phosphate-selective porin OprO/OprP
VRALALLSLSLVAHTAFAQGQYLPTPGLAPNGFLLGDKEAGFQLRIRGVIQVDGRAYFADENPSFQNTFLVRRARPYFEGTVAKVVDFRLMPDFGIGQELLQDAFIDIHPWEWLKLWGGKWKVPFGIERLQQEQFLSFVERGLPNNLVPDRDIGLVLHGNVFDVLLYELGYFDGTIDGTSVDGSNNNGKDGTGRVFVHPFARRGPQVLKGLGIGFAFTVGTERGNPVTPDLPSFKTAGQNNFFSYINDPRLPASTAIANGLHYRVTPQMTFYAGPFGLLSEYVLSSQTVSAAGATALIANMAWQVEVVFVPTLENASYEGVVPRRPLDIAKRQFGAVEVGARYGELCVDSNAFPRFADPTRSARIARAWGLAVDWWVSRNLKSALLFERTIFTGGAPPPMIDRQAENALIGRLQVAF